MEISKGINWTERIETQTDKKMVENFSWSTNAGRWFGIPVRLHLFLLLFVIVIFGAEWNHGKSNDNLLFGTAMVTTLVLLGSIILHELAHAFALTSLGGHVNNFILMPWGGNSDFVLPPGGQSRAVIYLAGPFANGVLFLFATALLVQSEHASLAKLVNPLVPHHFAAAEWQQSLISIVSWVNFQLMLVNLLPCFPFDGASIVRSSISVFNVEMPKYRVESGIKLIGNAVAFGLIGMAWFVRDFHIPNNVLDPPWLVFLLLGVSLLFAARYSLHIETAATETEWDEMEEMDYDSIYNESSFFEFTGETDNIAYSQWLQEKQEARRETELRREEEEDRQADEILKKVQVDGLSSLTEEEKSLLDRVSSRIRRRRQQGV